jgi:hypothetical protein
MGDDQLGKDEKLRQRKEEIQLVGRFRSVATAKLEALATQAEQSGREFKIGEEEKKILSQMHGMGMKEGIAAGCLTFLTLRKGPLYIGRWILKRRQQRSGNMTTPTDRRNPPLSNSGGYKFLDPKASGNPFQQASTSKPPFPRSPNIVVRSIWFTFDSVVSLMMAASVSMQWTDTEKIREQITKLPLVSGRSLASDALCEEIVTELQKVVDERDPVYERLRRRIQSESKDTALIEPIAFYLKGIVEFSENCQRRSFRERELRQEQGFGPDDAVEIPSPGVAKDGPRLVKNLHHGTEEVVLAEKDSRPPFGNERNFSDEFDADWSSNFVSDQEDERRK